MESNFRELWNDPDFIEQEQKSKIELEAQLIGKFIEARERKLTPLGGCGKFS